MRSSGRVCLLVLAILGLICALGCLACAIAAMAYQRWITYSVTMSGTVDNTKLQQFSRSRGMFLECTTDPNALILQSVTPKVGNCYDLDLGKQTSTDFNYWSIINIRRSFIGVFSAALACTFVGIILAIVTIVFWCTSKSDNWCYCVVASLTGALFLLAGVLYMLAMVIFHIMLDEEKSRRGVTNLPDIYGSWESSVISGTVAAYDTAYILAWVACALALIAGILFLISLCCCGRKHGCSSIHHRSLKDEVRTSEVHNNSAYYGSDYVVVKNAVTESSAPRANVVEPVGQVVTNPNPEDVYCYNADRVSSTNKNMYRIY